MTYEDYVKESIRNYMSDLFYLEGKGEDYFFGKSIWNDDLTLFYNDLGDRTMRLQSSADTAAEYAVRDLLKEVGIYANTKIVDLSRSALNISAKSRRWFDKDDELLFGINIMKARELEQAIEKEPKRWKFYLKHRDD